MSNTENTTEIDESSDDSELFKWEESIQREGYAVVAGTDEAGRGPLAGPVVSGAFAVLNPLDDNVRSILRTVSDSKKMTPEAREKAFHRLTDPVLKDKVVWAVSEMSAAKIDEMNILQASLASMADAVRQLSVRPDCVLVDGCNRPPDLLKKGERWTRENKAAADPAQSKLTKFFTKKDPPPKEDTAAGTSSVWLPRRVDAVIGGDAKVACIAAASVLAKVHRDKVMDRLHEKYPAYAFGSHKGYGTAAHIAAINKHGLCPEHRRSFEPIKSMLESGRKLDESRQTLGASCSFEDGPKSKEASAPAMERGAETAEQQIGSKEDSNSMTVCPSPSQKRTIASSPCSTEKEAESKSKGRERAEIGNLSTAKRKRDEVAMESLIKPEKKARGRPKKMAR